jgi:hypothetical protein
MREAAMRMGKAGRNACKFERKAAMFGSDQRIAFCSL